MDLLKKITKCLLIGSLTGIAIALFSNFFFQDLIDRLEYVTYYVRARWENSDLPKEKLDKIARANGSVIVVDIDDRSMQKLGKYWSWDRSYHAELIRRLSRHFPAAIVFDVLFHGPEDSLQQQRLAKLLDASGKSAVRAKLSPQAAKNLLASIDYDRQFITATRDARWVFHGICLADESDYHDFALSQVRHRMTAAWHDSLNPASALTLSDAQLATIREKKTIIDGIFPELAAAARAIGHVDILPNEDGVIREVPLLYRFDDQKVAYMPISVRVIASLFGTPNEECVFKPGAYLDVGKPFKVLKDSAGTITCSYPNVTALQVKALCDHAAEILSCQPGRAVEVSSLCAAARDSAGNLSLEMNTPGTLPARLVRQLAGADLGAALRLLPAREIALAPGVTAARDSGGANWVVRAPFDIGEWWFSNVDFETLARIGPADLAAVRPGERRLLFNSVTVRNNDGELMSSIPVLRGGTLRDLCKTGWDRISTMRKSSRMDFGRSLRIPLQPGNRHIITYFGPKAKTFPIYSYYDILKDRAQGEFDGKIFIIGSTAPALFDIKAVPHDRNYPAVEIHASLLNSFLTNTFVERLPGWQDFLVLLFIAVLIGFFSYLFKPITGGVLTVLAIFGYFIVAMTLFQTAHLWIEIARPIFAILLTFTTAMAYRYVTEEKDRKFLQSTFKQYLSPQLIDMMYARRQQPKLGGEEGVRTAYFTDIQGFSTFSEKLGSPTRLVELLNEYLTAMTDILLSHYGTLDKYEGDAILAFFGAPMPMDDHARQACLTALDMQAKLESLRVKWRNEGGKWPPIVHNMRMRIGINTGPIVTGNMGSKTRMNYTMMGDAVNLAARLESAAKQYGVYTIISHYTYAMISEDFVTRQLDKITVVGKTEPVVIYELIARKDGLDEKIKKLLAVYGEGLNYFYSHEWDRAIEKMTEADLLEPHRDLSPENMTPSKKISGYCRTFKEQPPGPEWNGVISLSSK